MNARTAYVVIVMMLAVLAALFMAPSDETVLMAASHDESSGVPAAPVSRR